MRLGIAFDPPAESALGPAERLAAEGSLAQVEQVESAARALGHTVAVDFATLRSARNRATAASIVTNQRMRRPALGATEGFVKCC
jgi:hypothetical protein